MNPIRPVLWIGALLLTLTSAWGFWNSRDSNYNIGISGGGGGGGTTPVLIQQVTSSANPVGIGIDGNNFKIPLPNPVQAGDALVLAISYNDGLTPAITDNLGAGGASQTWPAACATATNASNIDSAIYVFPNTGTGGGTSTPTITVGFGAVAHPFQYEVFEYNNIAASSPCNGSKILVMSSGGATINPGSFTPGTNAAGNLILTYAAQNTGLDTGHPTDWVPTASPAFTLLEGDIAWISNEGYPHAAQSYVQATPAAITPSMTATSDATTYNSITLALKIASGGGSLPTGIHINKVLHFTNDYFATTTTWHLIAPFTGNLHVVVLVQNGPTINSISSTDCNCWVKKADSGAAIQMQIWYAPNRGQVVDNISITFSAAPPTSSVRIYDISGAAAAPFDVSAGAQPSPCTTASAATLTPTTTNGLVIAALSWGNGPGIAPTSPTGAVFDLVTYTGESDADQMENADDNAHLYNTDTSTENWIWAHMAGVGDATSCQGGEAVAFKHG
jgi:hypothetical protein